jgi:phosphoribosylglycinamide formyltransferase-1
MARRVRIAVLVSGGGTNLQSLIDASGASDYPAEIVLVLSSSKKAYGLERAKNHSIPAVCLRRKDFKSDEAYARAMISVLDEHSVEMICLAGYMKLLPASVVGRYRNRILNIHPALLPKFGGKGMYGMNVHQAVIDAGESESGATVHLVDEIYDNGKILDQIRVPVLKEDSPEDLQKRVLEQEHILYPRVVSSVAMKIITGEEI